MQQLLSPGSPPVAAPWRELAARGPGDKPDERPGAFILDGLDNPGADVEGWPRFRGVLFAAGYVPLRRRLAGATPNVIYARSDLLRDAASAGAVSEQAISMRDLGRMGRFANQLWQYLFISMYGLRHGLAVEAPPWDGEGYFGFRDPWPRRHETVVFSSFERPEPSIWASDAAPRNVNVRGFFHAAPDAWRNHRQFIRRFYTFKRRWSAPLAALRERLRSDGHTLVAIHIRRTDYTDASPFFRIVPTGWYRDALARAWPSLRSPVLHVATDDPRVVADFADFPQLTDRLRDLPADLPAHVVDFTMLRESDQLLACNSSFSMMAALTAPQSQRCMIVDFERRTFVPFDLWTEGGFWHRFGPVGK